MNWSLWPTRTGGLVTVTCNLRNRYRNLRDSDFRDRQFNLDHSDQNKYCKNVSYGCQ